MKEKNNPHTRLQKRKFVNSLMLMLTYSCQFDCEYCELKKTNSTMNIETIYKSIDFLFTSKSDKIQLRFFGGEPLIRFDLIKKAILYTEKVAKEKNKKVKYVLTTNGLLLDKSKIDFLSNFDTVVMLSIDGTKKTQKRFRPLKYYDEEIYEKINANLEYLKKSNINYFVNLVVSPSNIENLNKDLNYVFNLGVSRMQFCYRVGIYWKKSEIRNMLKILDLFIQKIGEERAFTFLQNFNNNSEPVMLSQEIIVDTDGHIYFDAAIFVENKFPTLKKYYKIGHINESNDIDSVFKSKIDLYFIFKKALRKNSESKKIFENNVILGLSLAKFFNKYKNKFIKRNEHPIFAEFIKNDFIYQKKVIENYNLNIDSVFLYINSGCVNDCIFCRKKRKISNFYDNIKYIESEFRKNSKVKARKITLIGNEPLLHTHILDIVSLCRKYHFKEIEIMTSGNLLKNPKFTDSLINNGITSFSMPIFSKNPIIHDGITGVKSSLKDLLEGIKNIRKHKNVKIYMHSNLLKQNIKDMQRLERFVKGKLHLPFCIMPIRPKPSNLPFQEIVPKYSEMIETLKLKSLVGFPLCIIKNIQKDLLIGSDQISDSNKIYFLDQNFIKPKKCTNCLKIKRCAGTFNEYIKLYGDSELKPFV